MVFFPPGWEARFHHSLVADSQSNDCGSLDFVGLWKWEMSTVNLLQTPKAKQLSGFMFLINGCFLVPLIGGKWHILPQLALYTTYILPSGWLYATYHFLGEPETTIDLRNMQRLVRPYSRAIDGLQVNLKLIYSTLLLVYALGLGRSSPWLFLLICNRSLQQKHEVLAVQKMVEWPWWTAWTAEWSATESSTMLARLYVLGSKLPLCPYSRGWSSTLMIGVYIPIVRIPCWALEPL